MSFIKKDVNFGLLFLIIILAVSVAFLGIYYNRNYNELSESHTEQLNALKKVTDELLFHKSRLNRTAADLKIKEQDESELSRKYSELRDEKETLDNENQLLKTDLSAKTTEIIVKTNQLLQANSEIAQKKNEIAVLDKDLSVCKLAKKSLKNKLDVTCGGDTTYCD